MKPADRRASVCLVLHAHLPYVLGHGTWPHGEEWLWEAAAECYLPLLDVLDRAEERGWVGSRAKLSIGFTPILLEMLGSERFAPGFEAYLERKIEYAKADAATFAAEEGGAARARLADRWRLLYEQVLERFRWVHDRDLLGALRRSHEAGTFQLLGGPATHPYGPLTRSFDFLKFQYDAGARTTARVFGEVPRAAWMPECAYRPSGTFESGDGLSFDAAWGMEHVLASAGFHVTFVDGHLVARLHAGSAVVSSVLGPDLRHPSSRARPHGVQLSASGLRRASLADLAAIHRPHGAGDPAAGLVVLARDPQTAEQVWSGKVGYPASGVYREFHKRHAPGGHRYWSVTDPGSELGEKVDYDADLADQTAREDARDFARRIDTWVAATPATERPLFCAPYDAELFGHWWFEGPRFLSAFLEEAEGEHAFELSTVEHALSTRPVEDYRPLPPGSWGEGGDHRVWKGEHAKVFWRAVERGVESLRVAVEGSRQAGEGPGSFGRRCLEQAARSLLLLSASDWPFLIYGGSAADYAAARVEEHAADLERLLALSRAPPDEAAQAELAAFAERDAVFPDLDLDLLVGPAT